MTHYLRYFGLTPQTAKLSIAFLWDIPSSQKVTDDGSSVSCSRWSERRGGGETWRSGASSKKGSPDCRAKSGVGKEARISFEWLSFRVGHFKSIYNDELIFLI